MSPAAAAFAVRHRASLRAHNSFGLPARARSLIVVRSEAELRRVVDHPVYGPVPKLVLGGGSNMVFTRDLDMPVIKVEIPGRRLAQTTPQAWVVEAGAGERWHDFVEWTLDQGLPGLENLALIPGSVGATPVQNIGAYGVELKDRFHSLDVMSLITGQTVTLQPEQCEFGYRDSVFKHALAGKAVILRVRFKLPRPWQPVLGYLELERKLAESGGLRPEPRTVFDWVCEIRRGKLPDPAVLGNAGSFFKNPVVSEEQCRDIIGRDPAVVHYPLPDGRFKLAAGWLIDACGWKGKAIGGAGVYDKQALVLVNHGSATGAEVLTLAKAIEESVYGRFGIRLEPEPVIL